MGAHPLDRRNLIKVAGAGLGVGLAGDALQAVAQTPTPDQSAGPVAAPTFWTAEYWAKKGDVPLYMYRKRASAPKPGESLPVLFFVHGSSMSSAIMDLKVPGRGEYSVMNVFAGFGFDCWTMDHDGYGRSGSSGNNSDIASGVKDLEAGMEVVTHETGRSKAHFCGESSGALRAAAYAIAQPDRADRLVLQAMTYKGTGSPTLAKRAEQIEFYRSHNRRPRDRAMLASIFTRDKPGTSEPGVADALADAEMKFGNQVPTGTYLDMVANLPVVDPRKVQSPVLLLRGEYDGIASVADLEDFFAQLPNGDRQFVIVPGAAHAVSMGINRHLGWHTIRAFLTMPPPIAS